MASVFQIQLYLELLAILSAHVFLIISSLLFVFSTIKLIISSVIKVLKALLISVTTFPYLTVETSLSQDLCLPGVDGGVVVQCISGVLCFDLYPKKPVNVSSSLFFTVFWDNVTSLKFDRFKQLLIELTIQFEVRMFFGGRLRTGVCC